MEETIKKNRPFGIRDKLAYAAGDLGCNMSFALKGTLQTFWLVYMTMETGLLAALLLIVQIWDAINDPMIGSMIDADRRKYKNGKFKTYIFIGAIGLLIAGSLCFIPVPKADDWIKVILFIVGYVIWDAFYTVANVPYGSMLSLVTEDNLERTQLSTWRSIGSIIGNMVPMMILPAIIWRKEVDASGNPVINPETGVQAQTLLGENVFWAALIMGVLGFLCFLYMLKNITIRVDEQSVKVNDSQKFNVLNAFKNFIKNRPAVGATLAAMAMFLGMNSATTATSIMFAIHFGKAELSGLASAIGFIPMMFFIPFIKKIVDKYGKKEASTMGAIVSLVGAAMMFIFPAIKNTDLALVFYILALAVFGIGMGVYTCVSWALMADSIDYNEWKTGNREEGTVYSLHSFFRKLAQGVGPSIVLLVMGWLGYNAKAGVAQQTATTASNMCWLIAGLYLFSGILMFVSLAFIYNVDRKTLAVMRSDLDARKATLPTETTETENVETETVQDSVEEVVEATEEIVEEAETPLEEKNDEE